MKIKLAFQLLQNMGFRYVVFRVLYLVKSKLGWHRHVFPMQPPFKKFSSLNSWKRDLPPFFFYGKNIVGLEKIKSTTLQQEVAAIKKGSYTFFSKVKYDLGTDYDWITNPDSGYTYNIEKHWSKIEDLSTVAGDIKFVWEKARFSFLYNLIRYDYHFNKDQSKIVFREIEDFINKNPINQGPNYKCSQEISLRVLNWTFALYYYKDSENLTEALFHKIMNAIYWQLHHVYHNIHFSRIAVRNNHAITETLMLYLSNKLFPSIPETKKWSVKGKKWFEKEIAYQIYEDGTFLQYSMNYHRVVVQLLTWGIQIATLNNEKFKPVVYERAQKTLDFLDACLDPITGNLPNYGANDGALFFKLTNDDYRVYRSQLDDLRMTLFNNRYCTSESAFWYGNSAFKISEATKLTNYSEFKWGGYYIVQENTVKTFFKCGAYKDRPSQADNMHLDIWVDGMNFLWDTGSYKYNTEKELLNYFNGCEGHNTVVLNNQDQMLKGSRFIWYNWVKKAKASITDSLNEYIIKGEIEAFKQLGTNIRHTRKIVKKKQQLIWEIEDSIKGVNNVEMKQFWHVNPALQSKMTIAAIDSESQILKPIIEEKWYSGYYGLKEKSLRYTFCTLNKSIKTTIKISI